MMNNQLNWAKDNFENIETAWEGDLWDRRRLGEQLTSYVDRLNCGAVLAVDARWGEGKTWFVRHWAKHLMDTEHNVIYLDAFANDYLEDPFLVIASEIAAKLDKTADKRLVHKFKKATAVMQQGLLTIAPTLIASMISCALTGGVIPFIKVDSESIKDKIDDAIDDVANNIGEKVTEAIQNKIDRYEEEKQSLQAFKSTLTELAASLENPLVFIIDELDRCRPDFAIRLIERVKHFFDIPKIVFVLVMDKTQFSRVVCHNYGYDEKIGEEYLDKFIDFFIKLNPTKIENRLSFIQDKLQELGISIRVGQFNKIDYLFSFMALHCKTTTRSLIKIIHSFNLLALNDSLKNQILVIYLFLGKNLKDRKSTVDVYEYIVQWFKEIIDADLALTQQLLAFKDDMESRGRVINTHQLYGQVLNDFRSVHIASIFMRYFDEYQKNPDSDYYLQKISMQPMSSYEDEDSVDFKKEWEFYISSGLSI